MQSSPVYDTSILVSNFCDYQSIMMSLGASCIWTWWKWRVMKMGRTRTRTISGNLKGVVWGVKKRGNVGRKWNYWCLCARSCKKQGQVRHLTFDIVISEEYVVSNSISWLKKWKKKFANHFPQSQMLCNKQYDVFI